MPSKTDNKLEFNQYMKSDKMAHTIYAEIESLIKKIDGVQLIQKIIQQKKIGEHILCGYSMSTI